MTTSATIVDQVTYTAPGGAVNGESPQTSVTVPYNSLEVGTIEIPAATVTATSFPTPLGGIATNCRGYKIVNRSTNPNPISVIINSSATGIQVAPGGCFTLGNPADPSGDLITAASFVTVGAQGASPGYIDYYAFGT